MLAGRCLYSLLGTGFERWDAVILVLAGSNAASAPYLTQLRLTQQFFDYLDAQEGEGGDDVAQYHNVVLSPRFQAEAILRQVQTPASPALTPT